MPLYGAPAIPQLTGALGGRLGAVMPPGLGAYQQPRASLPPGLARFPQPGGPAGPTPGASQGRFNQDLLNQFLGGNPQLRNFLRMILQRRRGPLQPTRPQPVLPPGVVTAQPTAMPFPMAGALGGLL